ncbi:hypothetical protein L6452_39584 [Arctium lappa]|uniref:Uncharacterized protein n=1 Tax=Arctium lappa TaxID=4217 RepID=A0ACB8XSP5_ARCLA|nr:hypothetical protein L6452_39584 [Arctium lappa]
MPDWGIFWLINHGIPSNLLSELHEHTFKVFGLEFETKQNLFASIPTSEISYFWGTATLTPVGDALYKGSNREDDFKKHNWVEGLNVPLNRSEQVQLHQHPLLMEKEVERRRAVEAAPTRAGEGEAGAGESMEGGGVQG